MKKIFTLCVAIFFFSTINSAQDKPIRVGLKLGTPNWASLNLEYVTTAIDGKLSTSLDFSSITVNLNLADAKKINFTYFELGGNYYFNSFDGKGFYGGLSLNRSSLNGDYYPENIEADDGEFKAEAYLSNIKIGGKWGNSFYFRTEIGYGLLLSVKAETKYTDPETYTLIKVNELNNVELPNGGLLFNIGFGFAF